MTLQQAIDQAVGHHRAGQIREAESHYRQILAQSPDNAAVLHMLGVLLAQKGSRDEAVTLISRAVQADPSQAAYRANLGNVLQESGRGVEAIVEYRRALTLAPNSPDIYNNLGNALQLTGDAASAIPAYQDALKLRPDFVEAQFNLANAYTNVGAHKEAIDAYLAAIRFRPNYPEAYLNLGIAFSKAGDLVNALAANQKALQLRHDWPEASKNLGQVLEQLGRYNDAVAAYSQAIALSPANAEMWLEMGNALRQTGRLQESVDAYQRAISIQPNYADAHYGLAWSLLLQGDLQPGFREYEWRHRLSEAQAAGVRPLRSPQWDGSPLGGRRILLQAEQGFGDSLFAIRYAPLIAARGGVVLVQAEPVLRRLLVSQPGVSHVLGNDESVSELSLQCPMMSLPKIFDTSLETLTCGVPYILPQSTSVARWRRRLEKVGAIGRPNVGLAWAGRPTPRGRSIPFHLLGDLLLDQRIQFHSLQKGEAVLEAAASRLMNWDARLIDFADTAALIANLDLVITIDTAVAHLAGAMGKPTWLLLQYAADWRWFHGRTDSPWYPTMRIFRQPMPGDWPGVVRAVAAALKIKFAS
jgi:tetratricopeptide (TPR) repeat protein